MNLRSVVLVVGVAVLIAACGSDGTSDPSVAPSTTVATPSTAGVTSSVATPLPSPATTTECRYVDTPPIPPPADLRIERGDCGPGVYRLQQMLAEIGYSIAADGQFGSATEAVVKQYQQGRGALAVNGIVDATLWSDLDYQSTA